MRILPAENEEVTIESTLVCRGVTQSRIYGLYHLFFERTPAWFR